MSVVCSIGYRTLTRTNCILPQPPRCLHLQRYIGGGLLPLSSSKFIAASYNAAATTTSYSSCRDALQRQQQRRQISTPSANKKKTEQKKLPATNSPVPVYKPPTESVKIFSEISGYKVPSEILVYHAGRRSVYIGVIKLATLYPFIVTLFYVQPHINEHTVIQQYPIFEAYPYLAPVLATAISALPTWLFWFAAPYVTHFYVVIPDKYRHAKEAALRYMANLPPDAKVKLATMRGLGRPRLREIPVGELRYVNKRLGCANFEWREKLPSGVIKIRHFFVDEGTGGSKYGEKESLRHVLEGIKRRTIEAEKQGLKDYYEKYKP